MIVREEVAKSVMMCEPISDRIMVMKLKVKPVNVLMVRYTRLVMWKDRWRKRRRMKMKRIVSMRDLI